MKRMLISANGFLASDELSFQRHNEIHTSLDHPLVIEYLDSFEDEKKHLHIITEYASGGDLDGLINELIKQ